MPQRDLAWDDFQAFLHAHPDLRHVELQGEGEPLLHPRFFDMVAACRARGILVSLISNGSLLSDEMIDRLLAADLRSIHISLESADPARFQQIRGGKFAKVEAGLRALALRRDELGLVHPNIGLAVTVLRDTIDDIHAIYRFYHQLGLDGGIAVQQLQGMPAYARSYAPTMAAQQLGDEMTPRFNAMRQALAQGAPVRTAEGFFYFALFAGFDPARQTCPWLERGAYLASDGRVTGCCFMKDEASAFGHIRADSPQSVAARRHALIAEMEAGKVPADCAGCPTGHAVARARSLSPAR